MTPEKLDMSNDLMYEIGRLKTIIRQGVEDHRFNSASLPLDMSERMYQEALDYYNQRLTQLQDMFRSL